MRFTISDLRVHVDGYGYHACTYCYSFVLLSCIHHDVDMLFLLL